MNPFTWPVNWPALATLVTALLAVAGAIIVAKKQIELRRSEVRLSLFKERKEVLDRFRGLTNEWKVGATLSGQSISEFGALVQEMELLFDSRIAGFGRNLHRTLEEQAMYSNQEASFDQARNEVRRQEVSKKARDCLEKFADKPAGI